MVRSPNQISFTLSEEEKQRSDELKKLTRYTNRDLHLLALDAIEEIDELTKRSK